jgi:hypothetical protein
VIVSKYSILALLPMILTAQRVRENAVPLKNWATPLYWQPTQMEREVAGKAVPQLQFSANQVSADELTFIAITPCRLVDTRGATAGFNGIAPFSGPSIAPAGTIAIPVQSPTEASTDTEPAPCGVIPSIAQAYSFNLTVVPTVAGSRVNYVSLWPAGSPQPFVSTLDDPQGVIVSNAAIVPAGTPTGGVSVYNDGPATTDIVIDMNGYFAAPTDASGNTAVGAGTLASNTTGSFNTASGSGALGSNTSGTSNTAIGYYALEFNTTGNNNTASGVNALQLNTTGGANTASGYDALGLNTTGSSNTAAGFQALYANTSGVDNTATGAGALQGNTTGSFNTASGTAALQNNTTGNDNTALGQEALQDNTTGYYNTAVGGSSLYNNRTGNFNTACGLEALYANTTGNNNTACGLEALSSNTTGSNNTASGFDALGLNTTGSNNIAIGSQAANSVSGGGSGNIHIGSPGSADDNGTIRIGTAAPLEGCGCGPQTSFFVAGVSGTTTGLSGAVPVVIDANGQLGTVSSSRRFKEDIQDMGEASSGLLRLRPVTFRYKQAYEDGSKPIDYGLIAEEVADVYPGLVAHSSDGQIETVQYQKLNAMLLNEIQKQHRQIQEQKEKMTAEIGALNARLSELEKQLERLASPK